MSAPPAAETFTGRAARIALIKLGALGDVVRTTALLPGLRRRFPDMRLTWITQRDALPLVAAHPDVAEAVVIDAPGDGAWRDARYDWVISLDDDREACRLATELHAARRSGGYEAADGALRYTPDLEGWFGMGRLRPPALGGIEAANARKRENDRSFGALLYAGLELPLPVARPHVPVPPEAAAQARAFLAGAGLAPDRPVVGLNTGAGARWRFKSWTETGSSRLARRLALELDAGVVVMGGAAERERTMRIVAGAATDHVVPAPPTLSVAAFAALVAACDVLVSSDSLAMHLAIAARRPVVAFFGPTSDAEIDLYGAGEHVVTPLPCRRCYLPTCEVRPNCMETISVERLFAATARWVAVATAARTRSPVHDLPAASPGTDALGARQ